ncbi:stress responsive alpha-beta barrel domain-containing [Trichoderma cornu-damae]|uniref:Stress responsive alpha-beta barrel domain-containing n=1 Tax=Trichoderma cornu-damae TaxID=654480 RepID=A0A9P8QR31_9HYPO|nr:stress responsive alpha-beta barrel domain-containing [Trichoderma cornu-damae]
MSITHVVLFSFKPSASAQDIDKVCSGLLALKDKCLHATTQEPYIKSMTGGTNNSPEGLNDGLTHAFVMEFGSARDRDYYIDQDPAHRAFVAGALPVIDKIRVVDYQAGVF